MYCDVIVAYINVTRVRNVHLSGKYFGISEGISGINQHLKCQMERFHLDIGMGKDQPVYWELQQNENKKDNRAFLLELGDPPSTVSVIGASASLAMGPQIEHTLSVYLAVGVRTETTLPGLQLADRDGRSFLACIIV